MDGLRHSKQSRLSLSSGNLRGTDARKLLSQWQQLKKRVLTIRGGCRCCGLGASFKVEEFGVEIFDFLLSNDKLMNDFRTADLLSKIKNTVKAEGRLTALLGLLSSENPPLVEQASAELICTQLHRSILSLSEHFSPMLSFRFSPNGVTIS
jgi:hypothetical protein